MTAELATKSAIVGIAWMMVGRLKAERRKWKSSEAPRTRLIEPRRILSLERSLIIVGHYYEISNDILFVYFQLGVDVGSSTVARGVVSLVLGYLSNLVIEMAFLIQITNYLYMILSFDRSSTSQQVI
ncbi:hypothetical protein BHM03_00017243 [Ensete ventricosum]|nr:hypothetical protein BHM03_00017243 [Ensete ventricosum]